MTTGQFVQILPNPIWARLAGRVGTVVHVTPKSKQCGATDSRLWRRARCGNNPIVEITGVGRVLLGREMVTVVCEVVS